MSSEPNVSPRADRAWDLVPFGVSVAATTVAVGYVRLMDAQGDSPLAWFLGGLVLASVLTGYAAVRSAPLRVAAVATAGVVLMSFGVLALFSIGLPLLIAGVIAIGFALKTRDDRQGR